MPAAAPPHKRTGHAALPITLATKPTEKSVPAPAVPATHLGQRLAGLPSPVSDEAKIPSLVTPIHPTAFLETRPKAPTPRADSHLAKTVVPVPKTRVVTHTAPTENVAIVPPPIAPEVTPEPSHETVASASSTTLAPHADEASVSTAALKPDAPVKVAHAEDPLSGIRARLTSFRTDGGSHQVSLDRKASLRTAGYSSNGESGMTHMYGVVYTPTHDTH